MALYWGYYCKTCDASSARWADDPRELRRIYESADAKLDSVVCDRPLEAETKDVRPLFFLYQHYGHEVWVESDLAMLALSARAGTGEGEGSGAGLEGAGLP